MRVRGRRLLRGRGGRSHREGQGQHDGYADVDPHRRLLKSGSAGWQSSHACGSGR